MKRLNIENEVLGEATYYINEIPMKVLSTNILYTAEINEIRVDHIANIVRVEEPISIEKAQSFLLNEASNIFKVFFDIYYDALQINAVVDYNNKTLTLVVDPNLNILDKKKLAVFFEKILNFNTQYTEKDNILEGVFAKNSFSSKNLSIRQKFFIILVVLILFKNFFYH